MTAPHGSSNLTSLHFPDATGIVDLYHARQHLHDLAKLVAAALGEDQRDWLTDRLADRDAGDIDTITTATRALDLPEAATDDIDQALGYFDTNRHRMRYAHFRKLGLFIGSGAVEAGCRAVIGQRLKQSGMRWNIPGATGILTLRCHHASGR